MESNATVNALKEACYLRGLCKHIQGDGGSGRLPSRMCCKHCPLLCVGSVMLRAYSKKVVTAYDTIANRALAALSAGSFPSHPGKPKLLGQS